ncbi:ribbon-helix-helix protein, CopG family [Paenibacillus flagellatus]|uniref:Ribbon-helix-helix protein CopG domain-containing protein n=1 Tax=Paenibacillus flagellatus TaxID=2211139 RepID=A0A2V5JVZ6_9BACL|nr:ribbon-helix-helix protein, CopG family [Paenibacillus flagellatus]PYI50701.1 hypothetical protein DLM86_28440 [Paenibacillus flagellatus]
MNKNDMKLIVPEREGQLRFAFSRGGPREGAGRKGIGETRKLSLTLPAEDWERLEALCTELGCSKSELLRGMVRSCLSEPKPEEA